MLAQSHRHYEIVKMLQNETKVCFFFLFNFFNFFHNMNFLEKVTLVSGFIRNLGMDLWRCGKLKGPLASLFGFCFTLGLPDVHNQMHSVDMEQLKKIALLFHLLEHSDVGQLDHS